MNKPEEDAIPDFDDWEGYVFDTEYFEQMAVSDEYDEGDEAVFRMTRLATAEVKYLRIYNHHNGYYSHGFDFGEPGRVIQSGSL